MDGANAKHSETVSLWLIIVDKEQPIALADV